MDKPSIRASDARLGIAFRDQEILTSCYYIRAGRGKLSQQMAAQGTMLERFVAAGRGRPDGTWDDIEFRLWRIATETGIGEIRVTDGYSVQDLDALWVVNLDRELAAAARRVVVQTRCRRLRAVGDRAAADWRRSPWSRRVWKAARDLLARRLGS